MNDCDYCGELTEDGGHTRMDGVTFTPDAHGLSYNLAVGSPLPVKPSGMSLWICP